MRGQLSRGSWTTRTASCALGNAMPEQIAHYAEAGLSGFNRMSPDAKEFVAGVLACAVAAWSGHHTLFPKCGQGLFRC